MPINTDPRHVGRAWITPAEPGRRRRSSARWTITYEVGAYGYDERARLKIASRFASDWGTPQFTDPRGRELHARCGSSRRARRPSPALACRAARPGAAVVQVPGGLGRRRLALPGRPHPRDASATGAAAAPARAPRRSASGAASGGSSSIRSAPSSTRSLDGLARCSTWSAATSTGWSSIAPTTVRPGEPFDALVKAEDVWGNPVRALRRARCALDARRARRSRGCRARVRFDERRARRRPPDAGSRLADAGAETRIARRARRPRAPSRT